MLRDPAIARINRIEGQISGLKKMYEKGKSCSDIIQQIQAARQALGKLAGLLLTNEAKRCADAGKTKELEKIVNRAFKTL